MKHIEYKELCEFNVHNNILSPENSKAMDLCFMNEGKNIMMSAQTPRDLSLHRCYHLFCRWLWDKMPLSFKNSRCLDQDQMYNYLKIISGQYELAMVYKGKEFYKFHSISFGKMSNDKFKEFLMDQMSSIYTNLLLPLKMENLYEEMEQEFKKIFKELI